MRTPAVWLLTLFTLGTVAPVSAQLPAKPMEQWTQKEAETLLIDSPWAQTLGGGVAADQQTLTGTMVTVRLRSALPIRQALARLRQLKSKYDKMSANDKAGVDAKNKPLLDCAPCGDYYVVTLSPGPGTTKGVPSIFENMSLDQAKKDVVIKNDKGETRPLVNFVKPKVNGEDAVFFFDRFDANGQPLITSSSRKVVIWFDPRIFEGFVMRIVSVDFDVAKILINGEVIF